MFVKIQEVYRTQNRIDKIKFPLTHKNQTLNVKNKERELKGKGKRPSKKKKVDLLELYLNSQCRL